MMKSLAGHFLVASPHLRDPNFMRTVVLMLQHTNEGALGVILNRPSEKTVREVWDMIEFDACECEDAVYVGGPVPGPIIALHTNGLWADQEIMSELHATTQNIHVDKLVRQTDEPFRLFSGHAGWGGGQLEEELKVGGWLTTRATVDEIFSDYESLWKRVTGRIGLSIIAPEVDRSRVPDDPSMN